MEYKMESILKVNGMSCMHCVNTIVNSIGALKGVSAVDVSLESKTVTVKYDETKISYDKIKEQIEAQGYDVI
jgi:copper chaperone